MVVSVVQVSQTAASDSFSYILESDGVNIPLQQTICCLHSPTPEAVQFGFAKEEHQDQSQSHFPAVAHVRQSKPQLVHLLSRYLSVQIIRWRRSRAVSREI